MYAMRLSSTRPQDYFVVSATVQDHSHDQGASTANDLVRLLWLCYLVPTRLVEVSAHANTTVQPISIRTQHHLTGAFRMSAAATKLGLTNQMMRLKLVAL